MPHAALQHQEADPRQVSRRRLHVRVGPGMVLLVQVEAGLPHAEGLKKSLARVLVDRLTGSAIKDRRQQLGALVAVVPPCARFRSRRGRRAGVLAQGAVLRKCVHVHAEGRGLYGPPESVVGCCVGRFGRAESAPGAWTTALASSIRSRVTSESNPLSISTRAQALSNAASAAFASGTCPRRTRAYSSPTRTRQVVGLFWDADGELRSSSARRAACAHSPVRLSARTR